MRFTSPKRHQPPAIIVVALIDILIVLLIFLMVTSTFKQQPALKLSLPESTQALKSGANEHQPLVISVTADGSLYMGIDRLPVSLDRLRQELLARVAKDPELKLAISADKGAPFGRIIALMDITKESGIKSVSAFTKQSGK